jgi:hypothetical protein
MCYKVVCSLVEVHLKKAILITSGTVLLAVGSWGFHLESTGWLGGLSVVSFLAGGILLFVGNTMEPKRAT